MFGTNAPSNNGDTFIFTPHCFLNSLCLRDVENTGTSEYSISSKLTVYKIFKYL